MKRTVVCCLLLLLTSILVPAQTPQPTKTPAKTDDETIRVSSDLVLLDALVIDKNGNQVSDLTPSDFEIIQDGKTQKIVNFGYVNPSESVVRTNETKQIKADKSQIPIPPIRVRTDAGRIITFVIDDGNCLATQVGIASAKDALRKFINEQMLPDDRVAVYRTRGGSSLLQMYTSNKETLLKGVDKISWFPSGCGSAFNAAVFDNTFKSQRGGGASQGKGSFESDEDAQFRRDNQTFERENQVIGTVGVLNFVVDRLKSLPQRKIVFFLSEGLAIADREQNVIDSRALDALRDISDKAARASVVIYTMSNKGNTIPGMLEAQDAVDPGILGGTDQSERISRSRIDEENSLNDGLAYLADTTGGKFIRNRNFLETGIKEVLTRESGYYLIGYEPQDDSFDGKQFHKIEIRVKREGLSVASRKGFYGRNETRTRTRTTETPLYEAIVSPLQQNGLDVRLTTLVGNESTGGSYIRAVFRIKGTDLTLTDDPDGSKKATLDVVAVTLDEKGKVADEFNRSYTVKIPKQGVDTVMRNGLDYSADLPISSPGVYSFRIAVRDNGSKRLGSAGDFVEIPDLRKGRFAMTGLIATTITTAGKPLLPINRPVESAFAPVFFTSAPSTRQFRAGEILAYAYNLFNAKIDGAAGKPRLTTKVRMFKDGKIILDGAETPADLEPQADLSRIRDYGLMRLNPKAEPGEYILQVIVRDTISDRTVSQWVDFEVVQ